MGTYTTNAWLIARIEATQAAIVAYEAAILALATGAQSYSLDTGQTRQTVTKANMSEMRNMLLILENRLATLEARLEGASFQAVPGF